MSKDEIIQMACDCFGGIIKQEERENFIRFAKLVAEKEREACALLCSVRSHRDNDMGAILARVIRARGQQ